MVMVSLSAAGPFQSSCDPFLITQAPAVASQEASSGSNPTGSCAVNSDPALSRCAPSPVFVNRISTVTISPTAAQDPGTVMLVERFSNFAPLPQILKGAEVFLGAGASARKFVRLSFVSAQP